MDDNITDGQDIKPPAPNKIKLQLKKRSDNSSLNSSVDNTPKESPIKLSINNNLVNKENPGDVKKPEPEISNELKSKKDVNQTIKLNLDNSGSKTEVDVPDLDITDFSKENLNKPVVINDAPAVDNSSPVAPEIKLSNKSSESKMPDKSISLNLDTKESEIDLDIPKTGETAPKIKLNLNTNTKKEIEDIQVIDDGIPPVQLEKKSEKVALSFAKPERKTKNISDTIKLKMSPDSKLPSFSEAFDSMESSNDIPTGKPPVIQEHQSIQADDEPIPNLNKKSNKKATKIYIIIALIILIVLIYYVYTSLGVFFSL
jgi:hypothetical protein